MTSGHEGASHLAGDFALLFGFAGDLVKLQAKVKEQVLKLALGCSGEEIRRKRGREGGHGRQQWLG